MNTEEQYLAGKATGDLGGASDWGAPSPETVANRRRATVAWGILVLAIIAVGAMVWWPSPPQNLDGVRFDGKTVYRMGCEGCSLNKTTFRSTIMTDADFRGAHGKAPDFTGAIVHRTRFDGSLLPDANFIDAAAQSTSFRGASLPGSMFVGTDLRDADFVGADLQWANFKNAILIGSTLDPAIWGSSLVAQYSVLSWESKAALLNQIRASFRGNRFGVVFINEAAWTATDNDADPERNLFLDAWNTGALDMGQIREALGIPDLEDIPGFTW